MGKKSSKSTTGPSKFSQPYITQAANVLQNAYGQNAGSVQDIASTIQGGIPAVAQKAFGSDPLLASAKRYNGDVLAGKYLGDDPRLEAMVARARDDTTDSVGARFGALGGYGGTRYADALGRGLADSELGLRYQNYKDERDAMAAAAGLAPDLVGAEYAGITPLLALAGAGAELPFAASNAYASGIGGLLGNYATTTTKKSLADYQVQLAAAAAAAASDRRVKTAIRKVGAFADGLGLYVWRYITGGGDHIGVMADEVETLRPWALGPEISGFKTIIYGRL